MSNFKDVAHKTVAELFDMLKEKKKEVEEVQGKVSKALNFINNWWHPDLDQKLFVEAVTKALRGANETN
ncbi:hypothetical protein [Acinetobacter indicus]|uniref:Uncharacterized protein n=1 Tax=Acinetobacter indicus TaxID=756892 RepID=A0A6C0Y3N9_9GAMM|nr:hypothetical protein [Acinetobacter indicus]QIC70773.1 hypothetical protein FSC09_10290 [Acinetobacter indicus]